MFIEELDCTCPTAKSIQWCYRHGMAWCKQCEGQCPACQNEVTEVLRSIRRRKVAGNFIEDRSLGSFPD